MGKFAEALKAKLATLGKAKVGSLQDFVKDPQKELEQLYLENDEFFVKIAISKMMEETLGKLSPEKQQEINGKNLSDEEKWAAVAEAWEAQAGEEAAALAAQEMEGIVSPTIPAIRRKSCSSIGSRQRLTPSGPRSSRRIPRPRPSASCWTRWTGI